VSLRSSLSALVGEAFASLGLEPSLGEVVVSQRPELSQFQTNGALRAAKAAKREPRELAEEVATALRAHPRVLSQVAVEGPGFINLTLTDEYLAAELNRSISDPRLGVPKVEQPRSILVDFGGPNVAKSMHVGHLRSALIGDALVRIARFLGHRVEGDIHLGDWGTQIGQLILELERRQPSLPYFAPDQEGPFPTESPVTVDDLSEMYPAAAARAASDPTEAERARAATLELQHGRPGYRALWQHFVETSNQAQRQDFDGLGVQFDHWFGESTVNHRLEPLIQRMRKAGVLTESEGALIVDVSQATDSHPVPPLLLRKSDGAYLYATTDLATIEQRVDELGADTLLYVVDARQGLHFEQVFRAARLGGIAPPQIELTHLGFGTVNGPDGKPFKTRAGGVPLLSDLIQGVTDAAHRRIGEAELARGYSETEREEIARLVGLAALKFGDLSNHRTSNYIFDPDRFVSFEGKTGPYLLYAAVRIQSILGKAAQLGLAAGPLLPPGVAAERRLMLELTELPEVIQRAAEGWAPNHLCEFAYRLATEFNRFYDTCHILRETDPARQASWLQLASLTMAELRLILGLLGIEIPQRM